MQLVTLCEDNHKPLYILQWYEGTGGGREGGREGSREGVTAVVLL